MHGNKTGGLTDQDAKFEKKDQQQLLAEDGPKVVVKYVDGFSKEQYVEALVDGFNYSQKEAEDFWDKNQAEKADIADKEAAAKAADAAKVDNKKRAWEESEKQYQMQQKQEAEQKAQSLKNWHGQMEAFGVVCDAYHKDYVENVGVQDPLDFLDRRVRRESQ